MQHYGCSYWVGVVIRVISNIFRKYIYKLRIYLCWMGNMVSNFEWRCRWEVNQFLVCPPKSKLTLQIVFGLVSRGWPWRCSKILHCNARTFLRLIFAHTVTGNGLWFLETIKEESYCDNAAKSPIKSWERKFGMNGWPVVIEPWWGQPF